MAITIEVRDNLDELWGELHSKIEQALVAIGAEARTRASENAPKRTGTLARSYAAEVDTDESCVYVGALISEFPDEPYAKYVELGTSRQAPQPHLGPAITDNMDVYQSIAEEILKG